MTDAITTTVTWDGLIHAHDDELSDLRESYNEVAELAREEYGDDALNQPAPDPEQAPEEMVALAVYQQQCQQYDQAVQAIEKRQHVLDVLRDELGDAPFELKMLSGQETMTVEAELRAWMQTQDNLSQQVVQVKRNLLTVDAATVDAPDGVPREDDSPTPSEVPNALAMSLFEQVELFNNAGAVDFRAEGCGGLGPAASGPSGSSATPELANEVSESSASTDTDAQARGEDS